MPFFRFRTRSASRDKETDLARINSVRDAVRRAVESTESELAGFHKRLESARASASLLMGTDTSDGSDRDESHSGELTTIESQLVAAERRIAQLEKHLDRMKRIGEVVSQVFPE